MRDEQMSDAEDVDRADYGTLERTGEQPALRFARRLAHPRERVWRALTEEEHLDAWFPSTIEGEMRPGAPLRFSHREDIVGPFDGEMLAFEPPTLMALRWGDDLLRFELRPDGAERCVLVFTHEFAELGKAARDGAGWHACLDLLACEIEGRTPPWSSAERWRQVNRTYAERFGADAATIGPPQEWERAHGAARGRAG